MADGKEHKWYKDMLPEGTRRVLIPKTDSEIYEQTATQLKDAGLEDIRISQRAKGPKPTISTEVFFEYWAPGETPLFDSIVRDATQFRNLMVSHLASRFPFTNVTDQTAEKEGLRRRKLVFSMAHFAAITSIRTTVNALREQKKAQ